MKQDKELWTCPRCGAKLVTPNMWHSCGPWTVEQFLVGKGPRARVLFDRFVEMARRCGPVTLQPVKTRVALMVRVRFAGVQRVSERGMTVSFWLKKRIESLRFRRVELIPPNNWLYTLRITALEELDDEVQGWLCEAYRVGEQRS